MIKSNEIRLGNWFHHTADWSTRQPQGAGSAFPMPEFDFQWDDSDWYALGECTLSLDVVEPIPLTEDWLLKFGFEKGGVRLLPNFQKSISWNSGTLKHISVCPQPGNQYIYIREGDITAKREDDDIVCVFNGDVHGTLHVHQLMNLFHALTNQELTLCQ